MLTIHDCTFEMQWSGWGSQTPTAERVAGAVMYRLLTMPAEGVRRVARSPRSLNAMSRGALLAARKDLLARGKTIPLNGKIELLHHAQK